MVVVEFSEYKGNKLIVLKKDSEDKFPFSFGLNKAKKILEAIKEIQDFVDLNDKPKVETEEQ